jgi:Ca-activated chloride channel family protein
VVYSDGVDSRSALSVGECMDMVRASDVIIHTIQFSGGARGGTSRRFTEGAFLRRISDYTGGAHFMPHTLEDLDEFYDQILDELFSQYTLGYVSTNDKRDGKFRKVEVKVNREGVRVRARRGYQAPVQDATTTPGRSGSL